MIAPASMTVSRAMACDILAHVDSRARARVSACVCVSERRATARVQAGGVHVPVQVYTSVLGAHAIARMRHSCDCEHARAPVRGEGRW
eukprot:1688697-Alexandrium_andersonii.AAC.1